MVTDNVQVWVIDRVQQAKQYAGKEEEEIGIEIMYELT
jgi:hypothetical protein